MLAKYKLGYGKQPDCFESIKVSLKNPWTLKITVQEKERIGYVMDSDGKYYYFDQDGMVVDVEEAPVDGIPLVDGMDPDELKLYHKLKKKSSIIYQEILEATREMKKYELSVTKIMCRSDRIYVYIGNVCVSLGNDVTSVKRFIWKNFLMRVTQRLLILEFFRKMQDKTKKIEKVMKFY